MSYQHPIITEIYADLYLEPGMLPFVRVLELVPHLTRAGFATVEDDVFEMDSRERANHPVLVRRSRAAGATGT